MAKLRFASFATFTCGVLIWACSTGGGGISPGASQTGGNRGIVGAGSTTSVNSDPDGSGATAAVPGKTLDINTNPKPPPDSDIVFRRDKVCDPDGTNCKCINFASFGDRASSAYGTGTDGQPSSTTAFDSWLKEKSNANVTMVYEKPSTIDIDYLNGFDVILLQDLRKWSFSSAELQALEQWVNEGGGLIALNGYMNNDDAEVTATNDAIAFTGMSYDGGATGGSVPQGTCPAASRDLCPQATSECCYCWNNTVPITDWDTSHPVANPESGFKALGAYMGRSIDKGDGDSVATFEGKTVAASKVIGDGKAFLWCDEWLTYTSQWSGGRVNDTLKDDQLQYEPCYTTEGGHWLTADQVFQTKQFWYNLINFVAPPSECTFTIDEPEVDNYLI